MTRKFDVQGGGPAAPRSSWASAPSCSRFRHRRAVDRRVPHARSRNRSDRSALDGGGRLDRAVLLALALRRGIRRGDWSAFRSYELPDGRDERIDWFTQTGQYAYMRIAEEHERMMRGD